MRDNLIFYKEINFKETPIGEIPRDWDIKKLGDESIISIIMGQSPPSYTYNKKGDGLPFLQGKIEFGIIHPLPSVFCSNPVKVAETNDVLISVRAPVGAVNIAPYRVCIGRGLAAVRAKHSKLNYLFLFYWLSHTRMRFESLSGGSTFKAIRRSELESFVIPLPKASEQHRIAEVLSTIYEAIQKTSELIAKTERLKKGLMQELLTKGIGHKEFKDTEIGRIPKEWKVVKLENIISSLQNGIWGDDPMPGEESYPVIRSTEVTHDGKIDLSSVALRRIPKHKVDKYRLKSGDILLVGSSGSPHLIGRAALFECPNYSNTYLFSNFMVRIIPQEIDSQFLYYFLSSPKYYTYLRQLQQTSTGLRNLPKKEILQVKLPFPCPIEQQKIAEILSTIDQKLELERKEKVKLERIKQGLMELLLTGKVRVKVN
jgi:type I restriction enzyme S subunit